MSSNRSSCSVGDLYGLGTAAVYWVGHMWRLLTWLGGLAFVAVVGAHFVIDDGEVALELLNVGDHPLAVCLEELPTVTFGVLPCSD